MRARGFTLIELMIVVAVIAVIAAIAIPGLLRSKMTTNESSAIGSLRTLASAEVQFKQSAVVDQDTDGTGEFGFLSELAGVSNTRIAGGLGTSPMNPPSLAQGMGLVNGSSASKAGYEFRVYLPTAGGTAINQTTITPPGGNAANANDQEVRWCCYAWPSQARQTGRRVFCVNQGNELVASNNVTQNYGGKVTAPAADAAYDTAGSAPNNLDAGFARASAGFTAGDGGTWTESQ